jgi:membrane protein implicated in regulation of membrane protease activity
MRQEDKPDDRHEGFSDEELRRLDTWTAPAPPADFTARVMSRARAEAATTAPAARRADARRPPLSRAERERRQRRRTALATVLGAVALSGAGGFVAWQAAATAAHAAGGGMPIYLAALAFGGILLVASLVGHHDHTDHHAGDHAQGHPHDHDVARAPHAALVLPFLSLRFWIFGLAFFGLTGALLRGVLSTSPLLAAALATAVGLGLGYAAARLLQALARETVGQLPPEGGHVGREGTVLLPVARGQRGKVRVTTAGVAVDLLAESDDERPLPAGTTVLIVAMRGTVAVVERSPAPSSSTEQGGPT